MTETCGDPGANIEVLEERYLSLGTAYVNISTSVEAGKHLDLANKQINLLLTAMSSPEPDIEGDDASDALDHQEPEREEESSRRDSARRESGEASAWADLTAGIPKVASPEIATPASDYTPATSASTEDTAYSSDSLSSDEERAAQRSSLYVSKVSASDLIDGGNTTAGATTTPGDKTDLFSPPRETNQLISTGRPVGTANFLCRPRPDPASALRHEDRGR